MRRNVALAMLLLAATASASSRPAASWKIERPMQCPHCDAVCIRDRSGAWFCGACRVPVEASAR